MAENIDITIRARDQATQTIQQVADNVQTLTNRITVAGGLVAGGAALIGIFKTLQAVSSSTSQAYIEQERAARGLSDAQRAFSQSLQQSLAIADEQTNALQRQAMMLGVAEDSMESVTKAAIGLSQATGQSLQSSLFRVNEAINGNANALQTYLPALRQAETETEKLAIISEAASRGLELELQKANEAEGAINRRKAATQDLTAAIGGLLAPSVEFQNALAALATTATSVIQDMAAAFSGGGQFMSRVIDGMVTTIVGGFAVAEVAVTKLGDVFLLIQDTIELSVRSWAGIVQHALTEQIPAYAIWFAENFTSIIRDAAVGVITIIQNMGQNLGEAVFAIFDFIRGGMQGGMAGLGERLGDALFVGILDGFEAQTAALPEIAARQITDREQFLAERMARTGGRLGDAFADSFNNRMDQVRGLMDSFTADFDLDTTLNLGDVAGQIAAASNRSLQAVESRLLTRGETDDPQKDIARFTEKTAEQTARIVRQNEEQERRERQRNQRPLVNVEVVT